MFFVLFFLKKQIEEFRVNRLDIGLNCFSKLKDKYYQCFNAGVEVSVGGPLCYAFYFYECFKFFIIKRKRMKQTKKDFSRKQKLCVRCCRDGLAPHVTRWAPLSDRTHTHSSAFHVFHITHFSWVLVAQSCLTLCDPMDCNPPGSSVRGTLQARRLEWAAISFSRGSSRPREGFIRRGHRSPISKTKLKHPILLRKTSPAIPIKGQT